MKISRVAIRNFRQYQDVNLELDGSGSDFVVIRGSNGNGKTNFLNALSWCLYDEENFSVKNNQDLSIVSRGTISDANEGDEMEVKVAMDLSMSDGKSARITRQAKFKKTDGLLAQISKRSLSVTVLSDLAAGSASEPNPELWIEKNLPKRLEPYVLFDGERLENFFKRESAKTVQAAVLEIAQIDVLRNMNIHLKASVEKLRKAAAGQDSSYEISEASKQVETFASIDKQLAEEEERLSEQLGEFERTYAGIEQSIAKEQRHQAEVEREKSLADKIQVLDADLSEAWSQFAEWAAKNAPTAFADKAINGALAEISERHERGELPPPISESVLLDLLSQGVCVCGSDLEEGHQGQLHIQALLEKNRSLGELGTLLQGLEPHLRSFLSRIKDSTEVKDFLQSQIGSLRKKLREAESEHEVARRLIADLASTGSSAPLAELQKLMDGKDEANMKLGEAKSRREGNSSNLKMAELELERLLSKSGKAQAQYKKLKFAQKALGQSQSMFTELSDQVRLAVQEQIDGQFKKMIWKQDYIDRVEIDDNFHVTVWDKSGFEILSTLSAGEREVLAFAFSLSLNGISNYELPMVIDTPFGRMSSEPRPKVAQSLAQSTDSDKGGKARQVILLMTDTEYDEDVRAALEVRNPKFLELEFDQSNSTVKLLEV